MEGVIGDHQCGFQHNKTTIEQISCIHHTVGGKKWESSEREYQLFVDLKKAYYSVRREVFYSIVIEFGEHMKLVRLIKMCLNKTNSKVRIGRHLSGTFPVQNGLNQGDTLSPLLFNFAVECAIRKVQENQVGMKLNGTHQLLVYADDVNLLGYTLHAIKKNRNFS
jgi:hypothetical protein